MQDRIVEYPGRMKMTDVESEDEYTFDVIRAEGEVLIEGTPYGKETMLTDETAAMLGLSDAATPADAFAVITDRLNALLPVDEEEEEEDAG